MFRNRKLLRITSLYLLTNIVITNVAPSFAVAGVTNAFHIAGNSPVPELVDLQTGDFHYDVPIMEVPGPNGGYPINLAYQAGIQNDQEASWVGLGWNLAPGSIARNVNGIPDDAYETNVAVNESWAGGTTVSEPYEVWNPLTSNFTAMGGTGQTTYLPGKTYNGTNYTYGIFNTRFSRPWLISQDGMDFKLLHDLSMNSDEFYYKYNGDPSTMNGGALPAYDDYIVTGPGISGKIEPVVLENASLYGPTTGGDTYSIYKRFTNTKHQFRFKQEYSNSFVVNPTNIAVNSSGNTYSLGSNNLGYTYSGPDDQGFDASTMKLAGAKNIQYFTYTDITNLTARNSGYMRNPPSSGDYNEQKIGGFCITNELGITYHYGLPARVGVQSNTFAAMNKTTGKTEKSITVGADCAYTWLLTTITGSDFVDQNNNGYADEADTGNWTNFNYSLVNNNYNTRIPYIGTVKASDDADMISTNYRYVYALDAIYTKSHTALFLKDSRTDGFDYDAAIQGGGYGSNSKTTMKLASVNLYRNEDIITMSATNTGSFSKSLMHCIEQIKNISQQKYSKGNAILDYNDIYQGSSLTSHFTNHNVLKRVSFNYDYSLADQSLNSTSGGKLTLKSINFFGRNETKLQPSVDFEYELSNPKSNPGVITHIPSDLSTLREGRIDMGNTPNSFQEGDIIKMVIGGTAYFATLIKGIVYAPYGTHVSLYDVHFLGNNIPDASKKNIYATITQTKNPPYMISHRDNWGYFKSDYKSAELLGRENFDRRTNRISSQSVDIWSLRKINTSMGSSILVDYESDQHSNPTNNFCIGNVKPKGLLNVKLVGYTKLDGSNTFSSTDTSAKIAVNSINRSGIFQLRFRENIDYNEEFYVGQVIDMQTVATFLQNGGATLNTNWPQTRTGSDLFKITFVGLNSYGQNCIQGVFIKGLPFSYNWLNPLANTIISDPNHDLWLAHNGSFVIYEPKQKNGGGVRTKKITIKENNSNDFFETVYEYKNKATGYSSGTTSSEPLNFSGIVPLNKAIGTDAIDNTNPSSPYYNTGYGNRFDYCRQDYAAKNIFTGFYNRLHCDYYAPQVIYECVSVKNYGNNAPATSWDEYHFQTFNDKMVRKRFLSEYYAQSSSSGGREAAPEIPVSRVIEIIDKTASVGKLLNHKVFDNNNDILSEDIYTYNEGLNNQGLIQQVFHQNRNNIASVTMKSDYPSVLINVTSKDHIKGTSSSLTYTNFDFYTGIPLQAETKDQYGNTIASISHPAYHLYSTPGGTGAELGLKVRNVNNRNILSPLLASYSYIPTFGGALVCTITPIGSGTGSSSTKYKATINDNLPLRFAIVANSKLSATLTIGGVSTPSNIIIAYIYPDRKSFEFYYDNSSLGSSIILTNLNISEPLSASIQPWGNAWSYRTYNSSTNQFENTAITENSPSNPNAYKKTWAPSTPYVWKSDYLNTDGSYKPYGIGMYEKFDWVAELSGSSQITRPGTYWLKTTQSTLKDAYSNSLEAKDVNGNYTATKMAYDQSYALNNTGGYTYTFPNPSYNTYPLTNGSNTNLVSFGFSSFEELSKPVGASSIQFGGEIQGYTSGSQQANTGGIKPHSGNYSFKLASSASATPYSAYYKTANAEGNIIRGKTYRASVWVHKSSNANASLNYSIAGSTGSASGTVAKSASTVTVGDWSLLTLDFTVPATYTSVNSTDLITVSLSAGTGSNSFFDDFAVRPIDAEQTSYVYDPLTKQVTYTIDKNGFYSRFEYDNTGRLVATYKETLQGEKKISAQEYNFAKP